MVEQWGGECGITRRVDVAHSFPSIEFFEKWDELRVDECSILRGKSVNRNAGKTSLIDTSRKLLYSFLRMEEGDSRIRLETVWVTL